MRKGLRGKSIGERLAALGMAAAMVLSLVYTDSVSVVHAEDKSVTDDTYIAGIFGQGTVTDGVSGAYTIKLPTDGSVTYTFSLPAYDPQTGESVTVRAVEGSDEYELVTEDDESGEGDVTYIATPVTSYYWSESSASDTAAEGTVSAGDTRHLVKEVSYSITAEDGTSQEITVSGVTKYIDAATVTLSSVEVAAPSLSFDNAGRSVTVTDSYADTVSGNEDTSVYYYGSIGYSYVKDTVETAEGSLDSLKTALMTFGTDYDGTYSVTRIISDAAGVEIFRETSEDQTRNFYMIRSYGVIVTDKDGNVKDSEAHEVEEGADYTVSVPVSTYTSPLYDVSIYFYTDLPDEATLEGYERYGSDDYEGAYSGAFYKTISGATDESGVDAKNGQTVQDTLSVTDGAATESIGYTIDYDDGTPVITVSKVDGEDYTSDTVYTNSDSTTVGISVTTTDGNAKLSAVTLMSGDAEVTNYTSGVTTDVVTAEGDITITNTEGLTQYKVYAKSEYGVSAMSSDVISILYDKTVPVASDFKVTQGDADKSGSLEDSTYTVTDKLTCVKDFAIQFSAEDVMPEGVTDISGLDTVTVSYGDNSYAVTTSGDNSETGTTTCTATIPADTGMASGGSRDYTVKVTDKSGNSSEYTVSVSFTDETAEISYTIAPATFEKGDEVYVDYTGSSVTKGAYVITYTVKTGVKLDTVSPYTYSGTGTVEDSGLTENEDGTYTYTYVVTESVSESSAIKDITFKVTNENGYSTTETIAVLNVDITDPEATLPTDTEWHKSLSINVSFSDEGTAQSGIISATGVNVGTTDIISSTDGVASYSTTLTVDESKSSAGTEVRFVVKDRAGNTKTYTQTYYVDSTDPTSTLKIGGKAAADIVSGTYFTTVPTVVFSGADTISGVKTATLKINGTDYTSKAVSGSTLKDILGSIDETQLYTVVYTVTDKAGNSVTKECSFYVDVTAPRTNLHIETTADKADTFYRNYRNVYSPSVFDNEEYSYGTYYKSSVDIKLQVKEVNVDSIVVTDMVGTTLTTLSPDYSYNASTGITTATVTVREEGTHLIWIYVKDKAGLEENAIGDTQKLSFTIDLTTPELSTYLSGEEYTVSDTSDSAYKYLSSAADVTLKVTEANRDAADIKARVVTVPLDGSESTSETVILTESNGVYSADALKGLSTEARYTVIFTVTDRAGNSTTSKIAFTVDRTAPANNIYITSTAKRADKYSAAYSEVRGVFEHEEYTYGTVYDSSVTLEVASFDYNMQSVNVYDNGSELDVSWSVQDSRWTGAVTVSEEGSHTITMVSVDKAGHTTESKTAPKSVTFMIDTTDPVLTTKLNSEEYSGDSRYISVSGTAVVSVEDVNEDTAELSVTIVKTMTASGEVTTEEISLSYIDGAYEDVVLSDDAYYKLIYRVVDKAGNVMTKTIGFTVDTTAPLNNMYITTAAPAKIAAYNETYRNVTGHFSNENYVYGQYYAENVVINLSVFDYNLASVSVSDGNMALAPQWTKSGDTWTASITIFTEGYHEIAISSTDMSGNTTGSPAAEQRLRFYIDKTSPVITTSLNGSSYPEGSGIRYLQTDGVIGVSVTDTYADFGDLVRTVRMTPPGSSTSTTVETVAEGMHTFSTEADYEISYVATDRAGNESLIRNVSFRVDKTAPQLSITSTATGDAATSAVTTTFSMEEAFYWDMESAVIRVYRSIDGKAETLIDTIDFPASGRLSTLTQNYTEDGNYRFEFTATDKVGNTATAAEYSFTLDGTAPIIVLSGVENYDMTGTDVTLGVLVNEAFYMSNKVVLSGTRQNIDGVVTDIDFGAFRTNLGQISEFSQIFKEDGIYDSRGVCRGVRRATNRAESTLHYRYDGTVYNRYRQVRRYCSHRLRVGL